jgi:dTDP-4-dehydrorhamnose 3,5-epimerase
MSDKVKEFQIINSDKIEGVKIISPSYHEDERGLLFTTFNKEVFNPLIPKDIEFKHDKFSLTYQNVLRGIHGDNKSWKLVTAVYGSIYQVAVDNRPESPTFLKWESFKINHLNPKLILLPPGVGNAFLVLSDIAMYHYKLAYSGEYFDANEQFTIKWNDTIIGIEWPNMNPILSERDK